MTHLLQAATMPQGQSLTSVMSIVTPFVLVGLGWMQQRSSTDRKEIRDDQKGMSALIAALKSDVATLNTHVGVDGNGIMARLELISAKIDKLSDEMAEQRGARHIRLPRES